MLEQPDVDYYVGRAKAEREMAEYSGDNAVAEIHLQMAELYEQMIALEQAAALLAQGQASSSLC
jgi:hypothetical protein